MKKTPAIRLAQDTDAERIRKLVRASCLWASDLPWKHVYPHWIVAECDGQIVGALQVMPAQPVGRLEWLVVDEGQSYIFSRRVARELLLTGRAMLMNAGCEAGMAIVDDHNPDFQKALRRRHCGQLSPGHLVVQRWA